MTFKQAYLGIILVLACLATMTRGDTQLYDVADNFEPSAVIFDRAYDGVANALKAVTKKLRVKRPHQTSTHGGSNRSSAPLSAADRGDGDGSKVHADSSLMDALGDTKASDDSAKKPAADTTASVSTSSDAPVTSAPASDAHTSPDVSFDDFRQHTAVETDSIPAAQQDGDEKEVSGGVKGSGVVPEDGSSQKAQRPQGPVAQIGSDSTSSKHPSCEVHFLTRKDLGTPPFVTFLIMVATLITPILAIYIVRSGILLQLLNRAVTFVTQAIVGGGGGEKAPLSGGEKGLANSDTGGSESSSGDEWGSGDGGNRGRKGSKKSARRGKTPRSSRRSSKH